MPWPTNTTFEVDRMSPRLSSGYCRNVASCEAPITVFSPRSPTGCEPAAKYDAGVLTVRVAGAHKRAEAQRIAIESK